MSALDAAAVGDLTQLQQLDITHLETKILDIALLKGHRDILVWITTTKKVTVLASRLWARYSCTGDIDEAWDYLHLLLPWREAQMPDLLSIFLSLRTHNRYQYIDQLIQYFSQGQSQEYVLASLIAINYLEAAKRVQGVNKEEVLSIMTHSSNPEYFLHTSISTLAWLCQTLQLQWRDVLNVLQPLVILDKADCVSWALDTYPEVKAHVGQVYTKLALAHSSTQVLDLLVRTKTYSSTNLQMYWEELSPQVLQWLCHSDQLHLICPSLE